ncbi:MAG: hypothetical protein IPI02_12150 [Sterolibacteriaceae bacterium]|nr:hypothetical protein [Sterolibacteriaceae bacterium]
MTNLRTVRWSIDNSRAMLFIVRPRLRATTVAGQSCGAPVVARAAILEVLFRAATLAGPSERYRTSTRRAA